MRPKIRHDSETVLLTHDGGPTAIRHSPVVRLVLHGGVKPMLGDTDVPVFSAISYEAGPNVLNCYCDTDRDAVIRVRADRWDDGELKGNYLTSGWEPVSKSAGHAIQLAGLLHSSLYRVWIEINADVDPDLSWTLFTDGAVGPDYATLGKNEANPPDPNEV